MGCELYINFQIPKDFNLEYNFIDSFPTQNILYLKEEYKKYNPNEPIKFDLFLGDFLLEKKIDKIVSKIKELNPEILIIDGFFQLYDFYQEKEESIKNSFVFEKKFEKDTVGIHIRKGDIKGSDFELPNEWYIEMIKKFPKHKKIITTDSPNDDLIKLLMDEGCELYQDTPEKTIIRFSNFSDLILSGGSFSWWMGFLSEGNKYVLIPNKGWYTHDSDLKPYPNHNNWNYYGLRDHILYSIDNN